MVLYLFWAVAPNSCWTPLNSVDCGVTVTARYWSVGFMGLHVVGRDIAPPGHNSNNSSAPSQTCHAVESTLKFERCGEEAVGNIWSKFYIIYWTRTEQWSWSPLLLYFVWPLRRFSPWQGALTSYRLPTVTIGLGISLPFLQRSALSRTDGRTEFV